jgi:O-antigen ligase
MVPMSVATLTADTAASNWLEQAGTAAVFGMAAAVLFSIAAAQIFLALAVACWLALLVTRRESSVEAPRFFWALVAYGAITIVSAAASSDPVRSFIDCKQLVLFLVVPLVYRFVPGRRGASMVTVLVTFGALSAAYGIFQYGILHYDQLGLRARGTLGHYMTFSGELMLVISAALARVLFGARERLWAGLVIPALTVAVVFSFGRSAVVGVCAAAALLFLLKDFRLLALLPVAAALLFVFAPARVNQRVLSIFDMHDATVRDRFAMIREGGRMVAAHPLFGVGPNMVEVRYAEFRDADAVEAVNPHLHNVPVQIAAERGLPALAIWLVFIGILLRDLAREFRSTSYPFLAAGGLAAVTAMLTAGLFEYNFGDSEFLMIFLVLITLPFAARRPSTADA